MKEFLICKSKRLFSMEVVVPSEYVGDFLIAFGEEFHNKVMEFGKSERTVFSYLYSGDQWPIKVSVEEKEKDQLISFINNFCKEKKLSLREYD